MCGIIGIASAGAIGHRAWLSAGRDSMRHRGPDDEGEWWAPDAHVGFGFRRLAILDLSNAGHQPMQDASGELCIVFNGEIYNFASLRGELVRGGMTFRSRSDTEVLLGAYREWGTDCLSHLNGMFAFALYDAGKKRLFLARDRVGEKPLFYSESAGAIRFASEIKGLLADPTQSRRIDPHALDCYLTSGYVPGERCILDGMRKLPPAHALVFDVGTGVSHRWRYWQLPAFDAAGTLCDGDEGQMVEQLETHLEHAVRDRLVADVPVGILLSGGVDSSLITAMAIRSAPNVSTYTVRFPGFGQYDETDHARLIANHFGTRHVELEAETTSVDLLPLLARQFDEPVIDSSMVPTYLVSRLIRRHCSVALGGDGGDELFGGYSAYDRLLRMQRAVRPIPRVLRRALAAAAGALLPLGFKGRNWLQALPSDLAREVPMVGRYFDRAWRRRLMSAHAGWHRDGEHVHRLCTPRGRDLLDRATRMDFENYLPEDILVKVDRASMLNSLEVRAPMLDVSVIEFAFGRVPSHLKASERGRKILLKKLAARILPPAFDRRRKQGFSIPLDDWLRSGSWCQYFRDVLLDSSQTLFDRSVIRRLFDGQQRGLRNGERLFGLVMFELWRREYDAAL